MKSNTEEVGAQKNVEWISFDGAITKIIIENGVWCSAPQEGSICEVLFQEIKSDTTPKSDYLVGNVTTITIGEADGETDRLIDRTVRRMWRGERSKVKFHNNISIILKLVDFVNPKIPYHSLDSKDKAKIAEKHKEKGGQLFNEGRFLEAFNRFQVAARYVIFAGIEENVELYCKICNNLALCKLKFGRPDQAILLCNKVLKLSENNVKALVRRAEGFLLTRRPESARQDLSKALELDPGNSRAKTMHSTALKAVAQQRSDSALMAKKMLSL